MNPPVVDFSSSRKQDLHETLLAQMCGSGQRFRDRYEILRILGRGGFGITFLARDDRLPGQPLCVIKQLCPKVDDAASLQRARQRFEQEAKTLSLLGSHAQIPQLLDYFEAAGEFYLVQEYVCGSTLVKELKREGPFSEQAVKRFLREFLPLLHYVHKNRVIHRDIKPPNIIRCRDDGRLVLIDFGAVKENLAPTAGATTRNTSTQFVGTVGFAPPEQLASRPVFSSDIYAVGMTCLYLLTGRSPLDFDYEFVSGEVRWQDAVTVSPHFAKVLSRMLKIAPCDRYNSAMDVMRALDLEPYVDSLAHCMNVNPKPFTKEEQESFENSYVPPLVRRASAIRDWRQRLRARQMRGNLPFPRITYSSSP